MIDPLSILTGFALGFSFCGWVVAAVLFWRIRRHIVVNRALQDQLTLANRCIDRLELEMDDEDTTISGDN